MQCTRGGNDEIGAEAKAGGGGGGAAVRADGMVEWVGRLIR